MLVPAKFEGLRGYAPRTAREGINVIRIFMHRHKRAALATGPPQARTRQHPDVAVADLSLATEAGQPGPSRTG